VHRPFRILLMFIDNWDIYINISSAVLWNPRLDFSSKYSKWLLNK
jgi:hypothetical protein